MNDFGKGIRDRREMRFKADRAYSVRKTAGRVGIEPSYLSKIERGEMPPPSERAILRLARELGMSGDMLLAAAGKIPSDVRDAILRRPESMPGIVRALSMKSKGELSAVLEEHGR